MQGTTGMRTNFDSQHSAPSPWNQTMKTLYTRYRTEAQTIDRVAGPAGTLLGLATCALVLAFVLARFTATAAGP
jgi:hypothetical protein